MARSSSYWGNIAPRDMHIGSTYHSSYRGYFMKSIDEFEIVLVIESSSYRDSTVHCIWSKERFVGYV